jgi:hypothetical protein
VAIRSIIHPVGIATKGIKIVIILHLDHVNALVAVYLIDDYTEPNYRPTHHYKKQHATTNLWPSIQCHEDNERQSEVNEEAEQKAFDDNAHAISYFRIRLLKRNNILILGIVDRTSTKVWTLIFVAIKANMYVGPTSWTKSLKRFNYSSSADRSQNSLTLSERKPTRLTFDYRVAFH